MTTDPTYTVDAPCGCTLTVDHHRGERLTRCDCGRRYVVRAEAFDALVHSVRPYIGVGA